MGRVLIAHEKHRERYFDIGNDPADRRLALKKIFKGRYDEGYWYSQPVTGFDDIDQAFEAFVASGMDPEFTFVEVGRTRYFLPTFMEIRSDYEYEQLEVVNTEDFK